MLDDTNEPTRGSLLLRPRDNAALAGRFSQSRLTVQGTRAPTEDVGRWLAERRRSNRFRVSRIPFAALDNWRFDQDTGNLAHRSGRFFTVEGLRVSAGGGAREWYQPIIRQTEIGILGILVKEFDGVLHFLMQAKMEPGNPNLLQISPTVQATRSNYSRVHEGTAVRYLDYFLDPRRGRVLADILQSEHGSWFFRKVNRNVIVEAIDDVPFHDDFRWLTLGQINDLLHQDNVVNMDSRTVLSCIPAAAPDDAAMHSDVELLSWLNIERSRLDVRADCVPLAVIPQWNHGASSIEHAEGRYFRVVAVSVDAENREVTSWTQPLIEACGDGVAAFLIRSFDGVPHVLAQARAEAGFSGSAELGPTVQYIPGNYLQPGDVRPLFADVVAEAGPARIRYDARHSEEGGRFLNVVNRYVVIEADEMQAPSDPPPGYRWLTLGQLNALVRRGQTVNVQARTLVACLNAMGGSTP
jgi:dTDP-4-dehydro-6-deoxy-alpha-D-glucopyranose 2,3-dehydratase